LLDADAAARRHAEQHPVYCPAIVEDERSNLNDMVPLESVRPARGGEWRCEKLWNQDVSVFPPTNGFSDGKDSPPTTAECTAK
jgi:hypothetical protein